MTTNGDTNGDTLDGVVLKLPPVPAEILTVSFGDERLLDDRQRCIKENCILPFASSTLVNVIIEDARILTSDDHVKTIIELTLDNKEAAFDFKVGDSIGILPKNNECEVTYLLHRLKLAEESNFKCVISLKEITTKKKLTIPNHLPQNETLKYMFQCCIDIRSVLKKIFICALSSYTTDETERRHLEEISSREGSLLYNKYILEKHMSILDLLKQYPSCHPPVTLLLQHLPRLMPRPYSVCNSPLVDRTKIKICFSVLENNERKGVATGWMENMSRHILQSKDPCLKHDKLNDLDIINEQLSSLSIANNTAIDCNNKRFSIPTYLRNSTNFTLSSDLSIPIIMIGPGTGVAPFIGFMEERHQLKIDDPDKYFAPMWLYFGCRYSDKDFIYKKEINTFMADGTLSKLKVAHSREESKGMKYVQDLIIADAEDIVKLITNDSALIFVCGDLSTMGKQVEESLVECYKIVQRISDAEAKTILTDLKTNRRYIEDIWT